MLTGKGEGWDTTQPGEPLHTARSNGKRLLVVVSLTKRIDLVFTNPGETVECSLWHTPMDLPLVFCYPGLSGCYPIAHLDEAYRLGSKNARARGSVNVASSSTFCQLMHMIYEEQIHELHFMLGWIWHGGRETVGRFMMGTRRSTDQNVETFWRAPVGRIFFGQVSCVFGTS